MKLRHLLLLAGASALLCNAACGSSDVQAPSGAVGGPVHGATDAHCHGLPPQAVVAAACTQPTASEGGAPGSDPGMAAGAGGESDCNQARDIDYGQTLLNSEGDDDDCKYATSWTATPIRLNQDVTFTLTTSNLTTQQPLEALSDGDLPLSRLELYLPCDPTHRAPAQNTKAKFSEVAPGVYSVGPLRFDRSGRWVVRYHLYEQCLDGPGSPHGHVAYFVDVP